MDLVLRLFDRKNIQCSEIFTLRNEHFTLRTDTVTHTEQIFPQVRWTSLFDRTDRRFIVSEPPLRIITTAGVTAGIDGALHFVSAWLGEAAAEAIREYNEWPLQLEG